MLKNVIVLCDYGYIDGGAARVAQDTAISLKKEGLSVVYFCAVGPTSQELIKEGVEVVCLGQDDILHAKSKVKGVLQGINNKMAKKAFDELLQKFNPQETVIHAHTWTKGLSSSVYAVAKKRGFKVLITVHDYFLVCPNGGLFNYKTKKICDIKPMSLKCLACNCDARSYPQKVFRVLRQFRQNKTIRRAKNISYAFISEFSKREFLKRYDKIAQDKIYFLSNPVNFSLDRYRIECEENQEYLFIGSLTEVKGIRQFCQAVTQAKVKATVIGKGSLEEELKAKYTGIDFVGWKTKEEMLSYLNKARVLVFPSVWYEASPLTPLEVMAYGVPVICSSLNAASDYVLSEKTGLQYDGSSMEDLIRAINTAKDNQLIERLSKQVFDSFNAEDYSSKNYAKNLIDVLTKVLEK